MAKDNLTLEISPTLLEAIELNGDSGRLDYFAFLGLPRSGFSPGDVDQAVMKRSRSLRAWQNSPEHGKETVKLLPMLHRIAAVLKDRVRRDAYTKELERFLSGEKVDPVAEFAAMAKAAMADGRLDQASKAELLRFAAAQGVPQAEAGRILNELLESTAAGEQPAPEAAWEMRVADAREGGSAFRDAVNSLLESGVFGPETSKRIVEDAAKFKIGRTEALSVVNEACAGWFRDLVSRVAGGGALNDNQARLMMPKAKSVGLSEHAAYEILSDFTFTGASQEDLASLQLFSATFDQGDIDRLLARQKTVLAVRRFEWLSRALKNPAVAAFLVVILLGVGGYVLWQTIGGGLMEVGQGGGVSLSLAPTPGPSATPKFEPWKNPKPDSPNGLVTVKSEGPDDPPSFNIKITEVTCAEYQQFVDKTLRLTGPESWGVAVKHPDGTDNLPVTGVTVKDATAYCDWAAKERGMDPGQVRLPTLEEYKRIMRAPLPQGRKAGEPLLWKTAGLAQGTALADAKKNSASDALFLPDGQVYDLLANAAEWGGAVKDGKQAVLGGDYTIKDEKFDPRAVRWEDPSVGRKEIGFRYVIVGGR